MHSIRISEKTINFDCKRINKSNFYITKREFKINDTNVDKMLISKKEPYEKKVHSMKLHSKTVAFDDHDYIDPLCINLPQMIGYIKCF